MKRNYLKYKTEKKIGNKIYIASISLDDDCKNLDRSQLPDGIEFGIEH